MATEPPEAQQRNEATPRAEQTEGERPGHDDLTAERAEGHPAETGHAGDGSGFRSAKDPE